MKIILKQDVKGLGKAGSMVNASDGYARNFLIPKGLAVEATAGNIKEMESKKEAERKKSERELAAAKELAEKIKATVLVIKAKTGENGKLFGSITSKDIAEKLKSDYKIEIDKKKIELEEAIKSIGNFEVEVKLYPGVISKLTVKVEQE